MSKRVLSAMLFLFVLASVATLVVKEAGTGRASPAVKSPEAEAATGPKLVVYYLHGTLRCMTCNAIEKAAKAAVDSGFASEIDSGRIEWRVVDYDEPGNEYLATEFELTSPCVVLASMRDGRRESWKSLPEVWQLVREEPAFREFVQSSIREQLAETQAPEPVAGS